MCCSFVVLSIILFFREQVLLSSSNTKENKVITRELKFGFPASADSNKYLSEDATVWANGIVPYYVDLKIYDSTLAQRLRTVMSDIEGSSCVVFKRLYSIPSSYNGSWLHFTNPTGERECVHETRVGESDETIMVLGFHCLKKKEILHTVLHALGFKDEVSHPQRDLYIKIVWANVQSKYRPLFGIRRQKSLAEYDPRSVMHFHDRAFSINGGATIVPLISGMQISPSDSLSLLDIMKLRLYFGHECAKRKVNNIIDTCKDVLHDSVNDKEDSSNDRKRKDSSNKSQRKIEDQAENSKRGDDDIDNKDHDKKGVKDNDSDIDDGTE